MAIELVFVILFSFLVLLFFYLLNKEKQQLSRIKGNFEYAQKDINLLRDEKEKISEKATEKINDLQDRLLVFEKQNELLKQAQEHLEKEKREWSKDKETLLFQLSEELIKRNNEQQNQASLKQQEVIKKITENLLKNFENVATKVSSLNDDVQKSSEAINLTKQALLSPGGSGRSAEITLENILKNSGLREKETLSSSGDYILQSHFSGVGLNFEHESKRPDAILFFPNDQIVIIDSKSSPLFLELEAARQNGDIELEKTLLSKIKDSFKKHLESLKKKDYSKFLFDELRRIRAADYKISVVMFLQTEKMLEIIHSLDSEFQQRAMEGKVIVSTPIGLINFLSQARLVIDRVKQEENIESLKIATRKLLDSVASIFKESKEVGKSLNKALIAHNKIASNLNRKVYVAMKNIADLGIEGKKSSDIKLLEEYETGEEEKN